MVETLIARMVRPTFIHQGLSHREFSLSRERISHFGRILHKAQVTTALSS